MKNPTQVSDASQESLRATDRPSVSEQIPDGISLKCIVNSTGLGLMLWALILRAIGWL